MDREQKAQRYETIWKHHKRNSIGEKEQRGKKESRGKEFQRRERVAQGREWGIYRSEGFCTRNTKNDRGRIRA